MEQVCDTSHGEAPVKAWIQILQKKDIQGFSGDFLAAAQMCEQITKYSSIGEVRRLLMSAHSCIFKWLALQIAQGIIVNVVSESSLHPMEVEAYIYESMLVVPAKAGGWMQK
eukprot:38134-Pelagomonas_calceolata.AAC.3